MQIQSANILSNDYNSFFFFPSLRKNKQQQQQLPMAINKRNRQLKRNVKTRMEKVLRQKRLVMANIKVDKVGKMLKQDNVDNVDCDYDNHNNGDRVEFKPKDFLPPFGGYLTELEAQQLHNGIKVGDGGQGAVYQKRDSTMLSSSSSESAVKRVIKFLELYAEPLSDHNPCPPDRWSEVYLRLRMAYKMGKIGVGPVIHRYWHANAPARATGSIDADEKKYCLITEIDFVPGMLLDDLVDVRPRIFVESVRDAIRKQVIKMHAHGVVHNDLDGPNIIVNSPFTIGAQTISITMALENTTAKIIDYDCGLVAPTTANKEEELEGLEFWFERAETRLEDIAAAKKAEEEKLQRKKAQRFAILASLA